VWVGSFINLRPLLSRSSSIEKVRTENRCLSVGVGWNQYNGFIRLLYTTDVVNKADC
jgi:hypothetical protein